MTGRTVLITGVTRYLGSSLAGRLAQHPDVDRVIGVDAALPEPAARDRMGGAEFVRADIRTPLIARVLDAAGVDTLVHASASSTPSGVAARSMAKEMNVLGTMQLLAACQRIPTVAHLIVRSTTAVYGGSARDPAIATEESQARALPATGRARDGVDIEGYVRGFARRRPDVRVVLPRFAEIIGPTVRTPLTRYFSMSPVVPVLAGHDARLQFVHETDAVALLEHLVLGSFAGIVNVAGPGVLSVSQAIHRAGRLPLPIPSPALEISARIAGLLGVRGLSASLVRELVPGRVLDTTRLVRQVGFTPAYSTVAAFDDFAFRLLPALDARTVGAVERRLAALAGVPEAASPGNATSSPSPSFSPSPAHRPRPAPAVIDPGAGAVAADLRVVQPNGPARGHHGGDPAPSPGVAARTAGRPDAGGSPVDPAAAASPRPRLFSVPGTAAGGPGGRPVRRGRTR